MELYEKVFGAYIPNHPTQSGHDILINCVFHSDKNASLAVSTDPNKPMYYCHGCGKKGSLIGAFMELNGLTYPEALKKLDMDQPFEPGQKKQPIIIEKPKKEYTDYSNEVLQAANNVFDHYEFFCQKLYNMRGITMPTAICCLIGYDASKGWIFPCIEYKTGKVVGYEVREKYFNLFKFDNGNETKCYKAKNTPSCLCEVFGAWDKKKAIVCEGFIDAYKMYQFQYEKQVLLQKTDLVQVDTTILTSSCGVKHLPELVKQAELWNDFEEVIFCLDNDDAGNSSKEQIAELDHGGKFKFFGVLQEGEDFENWYDRTRQLMKCN